jgi:hypothetical protein
MLVTDREIAIQLMEASFDGNPAVYFSIGKGKNYLKKRKALAEFLTDYSILRKGSFFTQRKKVYERMGFSTYATVVVSGMTTFCMIREPNKIN